MNDRQRARLILLHERIQGHEFELFVLFGLSAAEDRRPCHNLSSSARRIRLPNSVRISSAVVAAGLEGGVALPCLFFGVGLPMKCCFRARTMLRTRCCRSRRPGAQRASLMADCLRRGPHLPSTGRRVAVEGGRETPHEGPAGPADKARRNVANSSDLVFIERETPFVALIALAVQGLGVNPGAHEHECRREALLLFISCLSRLRSAWLGSSGSFTNSTSRRSSRSSDAWTLRPPACMALCLTGGCWPAVLSASLRSGRGESLLPA